MADETTITPWSGLKSWLIGLSLGLAGEPLPIKLAPPTLAPERTWYSGSISAKDITEITFVDEYTPNGDEIKTWAADVEGTGAITCYLTGTSLTVAGNGAGKIRLSPDASRMFLEFTSLEALSGLSLLDTSQVVNMYCMFGVPWKVQSLDLSSFDTSSVTNMHLLFCGCGSQSLDLSSFDTSRVTKADFMFSGCKAQSLDLSSFDTRNMVNIYAMFTSCEAQSLDLSSFDTSHMTSMNAMFRDCKAQSLDLRSFDTRNVANMTNMFRDCVDLRVIYVTPGLWQVPDNAADMFTNCGVSDVTYV